MSTHQNFFEKYNTFFAIIIGALLVGGAIILTKSMPSKQPTPQPQGEQKKITVVDEKITKQFIADDRIVLGNPESKNIVIEVSDPSCPFCHFASGKNPELVKQSGKNNFLTTDQGGTYVAPVPEFEKLSGSGDIAYVFSYGNGHGNGALAAEALYCAHERGGFWGAHDKLMTNDGYTLVNNTVQNDRSKSDVIAKFLSQVIDEKFMTECLSSAKYESRINRDLAENTQIGFSGTPHFVINGNIIQGAADFSAMKNFLK
jgi:protein-disulfide isomerase